jgi:peptidyl-tRNA hydrolase
LAASKKSHTAAAITATPVLMLSSSQSYMGRLGHVVASVHNIFNLPETEMTRRIILKFVSRLHKKEALPVGNASLG